MTSKLRATYNYFYMRKEELGIVATKAFQIGMNILLFVSLRNDQKQKAQNSLQQFGLTTQKQLLQAQQISSSLQNHNLGTFYPEYVRAFVTLYLIGLTIHLLHTQIKLLILRQRTIASMLGTILMVVFQILDLLTVNDLVLLNSEYSNLSQAVSDIYVDSIKNRKDVMQLVEAIIRQLININKFLSFLFQSQVLWMDGLKPLIKNRRKNLSTTIVQPQDKLVVQKSPDKKPLNKPKNAKPIPEIKLEKTISLEKQQGKRKKSKQIKQPTELTLSKQVSQQQGESTQAESNPSKSICPSVGFKQSRSESQPNKAISQQLARYSSQSRKQQPQPKQYQPLTNEQIYRFSMRTNMGDYEFQVTSIQDFNARIHKIAHENSWNQLLLLNVKLHYWNEAYQSSQSGAIKEELKKVISQYALQMMNNHIQNQID